MNNLNYLYIMPILLVILSNVFYHMFSKNTPSDVNPFLALIATYGVALVSSILLFFLTKKESLIMEMSKMNISNFLLGLAVLGVEGGYLLMYRNGWEISKGSLIANMCVSVIMLFVGWLLYKEGLSMKKLAGIAICIAGMFIINTK